MSRVRGPQLKAELMDPFQEHLLQHLPLKSLAQLRPSCQAFHSLVDSGKASCAPNIDTRCPSSRCRSVSAFCNLLSSLVFARLVKSFTFQSNQVTHGEHFFKRLEDLRFASGCKVPVEQLTFLNLIKILCGQAT